MSESTLVSIGQLVRDIVYVQERPRQSKHLAGECGGGSMWNALANAREVGADAAAICTLGADAAGRLALTNLRERGVQILANELQPGKFTRTMHEVLTLHPTNQTFPKHRFETRCLACGRQTYLENTPRLSPDLLSKSLTLLAQHKTGGIILHLDTLDQRRTQMARKLKETRPHVWTSLDLGQSTGLVRMRRSDVMARLSEFDILFVHSKVLPEFLGIVGSPDVPDAIRKLAARVVISTQGERGVRAWTRGQKGDVVQTFEQPAVPNKQIVDTAGAGDAFIGAFLGLIARVPPNDVNRTLQDEKWVAATTKTAQEWASKKLSFLGARGHIGGINIAGRKAAEIRSVIPDYGSTEELVRKNNARQDCSACGSPLATNGGMSNAFRYRRNVDRLPAKVREAWDRRKRSGWGHLDELKGPGYVVGTGGSFAVAQFLAHLIQDRLAEPVTAIRPFDYIRSGLPKCWVALVTYSGETTDILQAKEQALRNDVPQILVITSKEGTPSSFGLRPGNDHLIWSGPNGERGFLSVGGVTVPAFMALASGNAQLWQDDQGYHKYEELFASAQTAVRGPWQVFEERVKDSMPRRQPVVMGGGYAWSAMLDFESKMTESGFGPASISELKDYSHGRFISTRKDDQATFLFGMPDDEHYRFVLVEKLRTLNDSLMVFETKFEKCWGALHLLLQGQLFLSELSAFEQRDLSKPPQIPQSGLHLYRYATLAEFAAKKKQ